MLCWEIGVIFRTTIVNPRLAASGLYLISNINYILAINTYLKSILKPQRNHCLNII